MSCLHDSDTSKNPNHNQDTIVHVIPLKSCVTSLPASILPSLLLVSSALTHLLADVLLSDRKLLRALADQSEPSLLSAAICRQDYLLVRSAVYRQDYLGLLGPGRHFLQFIHLIFFLGFPPPWHNPTLNMLKKTTYGVISPVVFMITVWFTVGRNISTIMTQNSLSCLNHFVDVQKVTLPRTLEFDRSTWQSQRLPDFTDS